MLSALADTACAIDALPRATPVTVTVCARFQFACVNVSVAGNAVAVPAAPLVTDTVTFALGALSKRTPYDAVPPFARIDTDEGDTRTPRPASVTVTRTTSLTVKES